MFGVVIVIVFLVFIGIESWNNYLIWRLIVLIICIEKINYKLRIDVLVY